MHCKSDKEFAEKTLIVKERGPLTNVTALRLESSGITDMGLDPLWALTELKELDLSYTDITDKGLIYLKGLKKLKSLNLHFTNHFHTDIKSLQEALPDCDINP